MRTDQQATTSTASDRRPHLDDGDTFDYRGYRFRVHFAHDADTGEPWKEYDGHGPVSAWTTRDKAPGERVLATDTDHTRRRYYDIAEATRIAKRDRWGSRDDVGLTKGAKAAKAVEEDFEYLRQWCADEWEYLTVTVAEVDEDDEPTGKRASLSGVESYGDYHQTVVYELTDELMAEIEVDEPDVQLSEN